MGAGPLFFEKNKFDIDNADATCTITDLVATDSGQDFSDYMRNRNNRSGWMTSGSTDAALTEILIEWVDSVTINWILLVLHNLKAYTIQYWNGSSYVDFSNVIAETVNEEVTTAHEFDDVTTSKIKIIIQGAMIVDADKVIRQIIVTQKLGRLESGFMIKNPRHSQKRRVNEMISGKAKITRNLGAFSCVMTKGNVINGDLDIIESLYDQAGGFLVWLCGNDATQFRSQQQGYRREDLFLMDLKNEWEPEWDKGFYQHGINVQIDLVEVV